MTVIVLPRWPKRTKQVDKVKHEKQSKRGEENKSAVWQEEH